MAHQSRGWCNGSHSTDRSFDLEKCYREPEFPLDDAILEWLNHLKYVWGTWKKCETVKQMLHEYFASAPNPYIAALDILVNCDDFRQAKPNSLAFTVMDEFSGWISDKHTTFQRCLSEQVKLTAFDRMIKQRNISLMKMICNVYKMAEDRDIFLEPLKRLIWSKQYKEACQIAALLNLHSHFTVEDFLIPLVFQDKLTVAEEFLSNSTSHQQDLVAFLDNLLGKRNIRNEADIIVSNLEIPEVHASKLYYKPLSKLVARLTKQYDLPPTVCPNLNQKRNEGALQFLIHKRFQENSLGEESWREMAREAVGNNPRLQHDLVSVVGNYDPREAYYFVNEFNIPRSRWPYSIENYFKFTVEARQTEEPSQNSRPKVFQEDREENWDAEVTLEYHTLSLPADQIILVNTDRIFHRFLQDISTSVIPMVGIDSEWKPYFGTKKNELALIQIATKCKVYILDVMVIGNIYQDMWKQLGSELFGNGGIMKIGFGLQTDMVMIKHSLPFLGAVLQSASNCLDILLLWKKLIKDYSFVFPYSENTVSSGESLTHLVELCLGRQLNKSDQFSNWERRPLRPSQITYAALDAYCLLEVYDVIQQCCIQQEIPFDEVVQEVLSTAKPAKKSTKNHKRNMNDAISKHLPPGHCYAVTSDHLDEQLKEVLQYFNVVLSKEDVFSRCKLCNGNEFAKVSQATMKKLVAASQRLSNSLTVDEADSKWDGDGFSSESDACSDEGLAGPSIRYDQRQTPEIIEGVDINRCLTKKGVSIQVTGIPSQRLEELSEFNICETCGKCYWDGTHLHRYMNSTLRDLV
ncbi:exonuclease mut-7 homolog isoform X2 [Anabrus simplex]|uniref:exonuclease mut-7 homolog isoform X2 n=1 Tax=Anabrus simplex TaxID=316456 RepID=UPI0035A2958A